MKVKLSELNRGSNIFFSYEWLPAFQNESMDSLIKRVTESSREFQPMFCAVTWHDNSSISITENSALKFAVNLHRHGLTVLLHLCCRDLTKDDAFQILKEMKNYGIRNIFALKGDHRQNSKSCFPYAKDLVQFIREKFGSYFTICVAGYPSGHPDNYDNKLEDLKYLKEKVDAGADFIITQIIFDGSEYCDFVRNCRSIGIQVPIIPGILPIKNIILTERIIRNCRVAVPNSIQNKLLQFSDDPVALENYSIQNATDIIKSIQNSGIDIPGVHFFTLNSPEICLEVKKKIFNTFESSTG